MRPVRMQAFTAAELVTGVVQRVTRQLPAASDKLTHLVAPRNLQAVLMHRKELLGTPRVLKRNALREANCGSMAAEEVVVLMEMNKLLCVRASIPLSLQEAWRRCAQSDTVTWYCSMGRARGRTPCGDVVSLKRMMLLDDYTIGNMRVLAPAHEYLPANVTPLRPHYLLNAKPHRKRQKGRTWANESGLPKRQRMCTLNRMADRLKQKMKLMELKNIGRSRHRRAMATMLQCLYKYNASADGCRREAAATIAPEWPPLATSTAAHNRRALHARLHHFLHSRPQRSYYDWDHLKLCFRSHAGGRDSPHWRRDVLNACVDSHTGTRVCWRDRDGCVMHCSDVRCAFRVPSVHGPSSCVALGDTYIHPTYHNIHNT